MDDDELVTFPKTNLRRSKTVSLSNGEDFSRTRSPSILNLEKSIEWKPSKKEVVSLWKDFKHFAMKGNVLEMAAGIIVGGAFSKIVNSLVNDIIMPPIGLLLSGVDFQNLFFVLKQGKNNQSSKTYKSLAQAKAAGAVTINFGVFFNFLLNFTVLSVVIFLLLRFIGKMKREKKKCKYCYSKVDMRATRCAFCTTKFTKESSRRTFKLELERDTRPEVDDDSTERQ